MSNDPLDQFAADFRQEVLAKAGDEVNPLLREEAFTEYVLEVLSDHNEVFDWELCFHQAKSAGRTHAMKVNAWALSGDGATLDLFITLFHDSDTITEVGKPDIRRQLQLLRGFLKRAFSGLYVTLEESTDVFRAAQQINEAKDSLTAVRLFFLTDGLVRSMTLDEEPFETLETRYVVWDIEKLSRLRVGTREVVELDFVEDYGGGLPCLETRDSSGEYRTFLAFMPAPVVARIYGLHGQRLLERNVRAFLQSKGKINKGLQKTLRDEPHRFLAYNNGLCCTAAEVRIAPGSHGQGRLEWARDFQIVNGAQTTASIYHAMKKERLDISNVAVQVKLTVMNDPDEVSAVVPLIAKYANSQNKVNTADLAANGAFHRQLETCSRTLWAPAASGLERGTHWYYERARGSYHDDKAQQGTPARVRDWAKQNPLHQKFTKTDLAKFEHAWLGLPHLVCRGAEKNFKEFADRLEKDGDPVVDEDFFRRVVAKAILWRASEKLFDSLDTAGYRANSVAYAIAWLAEDSSRRIDLDRIWRQQDLSSEITEALRAAVNAAHEFLTGQAGNIGEASKKAECWSQFRGSRIAVGTKWRRDLADIAPTAAPTLHAPAHEPAIAEAITFSAEYWFALSKWAKEHGFLQPWQRSLAFSLGRLAARGKAPSPKQAVQAMVLVERSRALGYRPGD